MVLASFLAFLAVFLLVGIGSAYRARDTTEDYFLASRTVSPWLVALSAIATNNSGYMFIGVIGFTYTTGLPAAWLMIGWIAGDFLASLLGHRELRISAERSGEITFPGTLARWSGRPQPTLQRVAGGVSVVFLGAYAAAQLAAGGKALNALFGWSTDAGALLVAIVVAIYCLAGGIRASIWTDAAQSLVMLVAMAALFAVAVGDLGGLRSSWDALAAIPGYLDWTPDDLLVPGAAGVALFAVGWMFAGLSVLGQPHIMIRFMALDSPAGLWRARVWYYGFFTLFYALATGVGLLSRIHLPELSGMDPELALPTMAQRLLPPAAVGLILAGIFAATMSTADSLVISCSASLTQDLPARPIDSRRIGKIATLAVTGFALLLVLSDQRSVFDLVILAWSTLASAFVPLLILLARGHEIPQARALAMMLTGVAVALAWRWLGLHDRIYEGMPGILAGLAVFYLSRAPRSGGLRPRADPFAR